ncbi:MAG: DUF523 domain-containing protein [Mariprofundaceae bacterium]|nr:DUF523 domain-containing protein [Mariprofundaceae bacterium]
MEKILVSACLLGEKVRYDGSDSAVHGLLDTWQQQGRIIPHCPEQAGGLPIPRAPAEIEQGDANGVLSGKKKVQTRAGNDVTDAFIDGAEQALAQCWQHNIKIAVLKDGSPSCASSKINNGKFSGIKIKGVGVTTSLLISHGISVFGEEDMDAAAQRLAELEKTHGE